MEKQQNRWELLDKTSKYYGKFQYGPLLSIYDLKCVIQKTVHWWSNYTNKSERGVNTEQNRCKLVEKCVQKCPKMFFFYIWQNIVTFKKEDTSTRREQGLTVLPFTWRKHPTAIGNYSVHVPIHGNTRKDRSPQSATEKLQKQSTRRPKISQHVLIGFLHSSIFHIVPQPQGPMWSLLAWTSLGISGYIPQLPL